jgi:hypothetical protein
MVLPHFWQTPNALSEAAAEEFFFPADFFCAAMFLFFSLVLVSDVNAFQAGRVAPKPLYRFVLKHVIPFFSRAHISGRIFLHIIALYHIKIKSAPGVGSGFSNLLAFLG